MRQDPCRPTHEELLAYIHGDDSVLWDFSTRQLDACEILIAQVVLKNLNLFPGWEEDIRRTVGVATELQKDEDVFTVENLLSCGFIAENMDQLDASQKDVLMKLCQVKIAVKNKKPLTIPALLALVLERPVDKNWTRRMKTALSKVRYPIENRSLIYLTDEEITKFDQLFRSEGGVSVMDIMEIYTDLGKDEKIRFIIFESSSIHFPELVLVELLRKSEYGQDYEQHLASKRFVGTEIWERYRGEL